MSAAEPSKSAIPRLGHVTLRVRDVERSEAFYREVLGLPVAGRRPGRAVFFSRGEQHHDLAVFAPGEDVPPAPPRRIGLGHVALKLPDLAHLKAAYQRCKAQGVKIVRVEAYEGSSSSFYIKDPDGIGIEIYCDDPNQRGTAEDLRRQLEAE